MKTDPKRLSQIKMTYESGAKDFSRRTSEGALTQDNMDILTLREEFCQMLSKDAHILDLGCGPGRDAKFFEEKGFQVTGCDICETFILALQDTLKGTYVIDDIVDSESPIYQVHYDVIWANSSLIAVSRDEAKIVIQNCFLSLREGGCFFVAVKCHANETCIIEKESISMPGKFISYLFYSEEDILSDIRDAGFTIVSFSKNQGIAGRDTFIRIFAKK